MAKRRCVLVILLFCLIGCCSSEPGTSSDVGSLVKKTKIEWHHSTNCKGHTDVLTKMVFEVEGHEMWFLDMEGRDWKAVVHSPECPKCNGKSNSILSDQSSYFGW